ncbi:MAG: hypothetical protein U0031_14385 [Thermomicrobiales bacterium]
MYGSDIALKHLVSESRVRDFHAEAERQRQIDLALAGQLDRRSDRLNDIRAMIASQLIRFGSWLMPENAPERVCQPSA